MVRSRMPATTCLSRSNCWLVWSGCVKEVHWLQRKQKAQTYVRVRAGGCRRGGRGSLPSTLPNPPHSHRVAPAFGS
eukprot:1645327-Prymnesium_polylepis.1